MGSRHKKDEITTKDTKKTKKDRNQRRIDRAAPANSLLQSSFSSFSCLSWLSLRNARSIVVFDQRPFALEALVRPCRVVFRVVAALAHRIDGEKPLRFCLGGLIRRRLPRIQQRLPF